jgi:hypothetical protein
MRSMTCPLAAALYLWERRALLPGAEQRLGSRAAVEIETCGAWSCRSVNDARAGRWNKQAHGEAVDISLLPPAGC